MPLDRLPRWAQDMLAGAQVARMAFVDENDRPRVLPVTFAVADGAIWTAVDRKPKRADREIARVRFLRRRPAAALCVDRYDEDWSRLAWVQLMGRVGIIALEDGSQGLRALTHKYPLYKDERPPGPLLRLEVQRTLHWRASE